jgi:type II secretory pathway pseudopilin PulG
MFFNLPSKRQCKQGWTLVEIMVAAGLFSLSSLALGTIFLFSLKSFASMANYAMLDRENRAAMDVLTREIRQAKLVTGYVTNASGNSLSIRNGDGQDVTFSFDSANQQFVRTVNGYSGVLLTNCNLLSFNLFQRTPQGSNFGMFPITYGNYTQSVKVVQLTWKTSRLVPAGPVNSENIQTARIVIRKQQD